MIRSALIILSGCIWISVETGIVLKIGYLRIFKQAYAFHHNMMMNSKNKCSVAGEKGIDRDRGEPVGSRRNIGGVGILWVDDGKPHEGVTGRQTIVLLAF